MQQVPNSLPAPCQLRATSRVCMVWAGHALSAVGALPLCRGPARRGTPGAVAARVMQARTMAHRLDRTQPQPRLWHRQQARTEPAHCAQCQHAQQWQASFCARLCAPSHLGPRLPAPRPPPARTAAGRRGICAAPLPAPRAHCARCRARALHWPNGAAPHPRRPPAHPQASSHDVRFAIARAWWGRSTLLRWCAGSSSRLDRFSLARVCMDEDGALPPASFSRLHHSHPQAHTHAHTHTHAHPSSRE